MEYAFKQLCSSGSLAFATTFKGRVKGADAFYNGDAETVSGIQVIDDYTLKIELEKPDPSFLYVLAQPSTAAVSKKAMEKYGDKMRVGAGPFVFSGEADGLRFTRNKEWFLSDAFGNQLPYIDTLSVKFVDTKEKQLHAFFDSQIDIVTGLYLDPVRQLLEEHVAEFSGKNPKYVMNRETESVGYESYTIMKNGIIGFNDNFMGYRDFSQVQLSD
ncbi:MAG: hypothetical protein JKX84_02095, partial [Flavobacteriales bacterium]|nr:hypothetical protein [Flavobacteriales bacterium]